MKVRDLMHPNVQTVRVDDLLPAVVDILADQHITAVAVVNERDRLVGVVSTADVLSAQAESVEAPEAWQSIEVEEVMTTPALTISPDETVDAAAQHLLYADVHRLFVVDDQAVVGVISQTDIVRALAARRLE